MHRHRAAVAAYADRAINTIQGSRRATQPYSHATPTVQTVARRATRRDRIAQMKMEVADRRRWVREKPVWCRERLLLSLGELLGEQHRVLPQFSILIGTPSTT
jgi:hypothetical protein